MAMLFSHSSSSTAARCCAALVAVVALAFPAAGRAQDLPSYARSVTVSTDETIHGRIRSVDGAFLLTVDDDRGFVDSVALHPGTIINPTGLTLSAGMSVTILGYNGGSSFQANEIDTPYTYAGPLPTPVYYGPGYWCPGFAYGYGPSFSLAIVFGGGGWGGYGGPWSFRHHPFIGRPWNGHAYFGNAIAASFNGSRMEIHRTALGPSQRAPSAVGVTARAPQHVPSAFAGRTFAGGEGPRTERFATSAGAAAAQRPASVPAPSSYARPGGGYERTGSYQPRGGGFERAGGFQQRGGFEHGGGAVHSARPR